MIGERRLRVLVVSLGRRGGVTRYGFHMARALADLADVAAVFSSGAENRQRWREVDVPLLEVDTFSGLAGMLRSLLDIPRLLRVRRFARAFGPDIVYYPGGHAWKPLLGLLLPRTATTVLTVHDPELHEGANALPFRLFDAANRLGTDGYVLLNARQAPGFARRHGLALERLAVIPHGIFDDTVGARRPLSEVGSLAELGGMEGGYALFVGRIQPYKGLSTLLEAYATIPPEERMPLVIAGEGALSERERFLLGEVDGPRVFVLSRWLSDEEMASLVGGARFVVLPYLTATQSGVIPLAAAFAVPAIASDAGGIVEQVVDGETGFLFPAGDARVLAESIRRAFAMPQTDYARMSERCLAYARENWSWSVLAARLIDFFESLRM